MEENVRTALLFSSIVAVAAVSPSALPVGPVINGDVSSIITVTNWLDEFPTESVALIFTE